MQPTTILKEEERKIFACHFTLSISKKSPIYVGVRYYKKLPQGIKNQIFVEPYKKKLIS